MYFSKSTLFTCEEEVIDPRATNCVPVSQPVGLSRLTKTLKEVNKQNKQFSLKLAFQFEAIQYQISNFGGYKNVLAESNNKLQGPVTI